MTPRPHFPLWLGRPAPRYTSYPPATQFRKAEAGEGQAALAGLNVNEPISLYIHVPFCRSLCLFCGCHQVITQRSDRIASYLEALHREIRQAAALYPHKLDVAHLHFGGGSPSILTPEQMRALMSEIRAAFHLLPQAELAIELDPRTATPELVHTLAAEGFNRASLGVQDFAPEVQQLVHRVQPREMVASVMQLLRGAGIRAISLDLMYGLPGQSVASVTATAREAAALSPDRVSLFSYAHVPEMKPYQKKLEQAGLPAEMEKLAQEAAMRSTLQTAGFEAIGIDHFAQPHDPLAKALHNGTLSRNFQGYTDDPAAQMLGLGASAISYIGDATQSAYVQNEPDLMIYQQRVLAGEVPSKRICVLDARDNLRAALISDLMCVFAVDLAKYGLAVADFSQALAPFVESGLVRVNGTRLEVDTEFRMAVRAVCTVFDDYYDPARLSSRVA